MNRSELEVLCGEGLSIREIASRHNCSFTTVRYWLRKHEIKVQRGWHGRLPKDLLNKRRCKCGETDPSKFYGNKRGYCARCHNSHVIQSAKIMAARIRKHLGGKCIVCGFKKYQTALDVHHLDPSTKDISFHSIKKWKWERIVSELTKCVLACKCCHTAYHTRELSENKRGLLEI